MMAGESIPIKRKLGYSVGHAFNDLTASMWYTYLIAYFHEVKNFNDTLAGTLMMIGQSVDAVLTPLVGLASDNSKSGCFNIGRRKSWHLIGNSFRIIYFKKYICYLITSFFFTGSFILFKGRFVAALDSLSSLYLVGSALVSPTGHNSYTTYPSLLYSNLDGRVPK